MPHSPKEALGLCDAADCEQVATQKIEVSAGKYGILMLSVCNNCVEKFIDNEGTEPLTAQHQIPTKEPIPDRCTGRRSNIGNQEAYQHSS